MKQWNIYFRIWHWAHAFVVLALIATVILRKTFLSYKSNSEIIVSKLSSLNIEISVEQGKMIAKAIRAPMWEWHIIFGYALVSLLLVRLVLLFTHSGRQNLINLKSFTLHKKLVSVGYIGLYLVLGFMAVSGLVLTYQQDLGLLKETAHTIKEVHEALFNLIWVFVIAHIAGLLVAEHRDENGIVSGMINGGKQ